MARPAVQITERDRQLLAFAAEHRFVLAAQIAALLAIGADAAGARMRALRGAGYLRSERPLRFEPTAFQVTQAGIGAAGSDLGRPRRVDLAAYRHDVGAAWLTVAARRGLFGEAAAVVSERRMRSEDARLQAAAPAERPVHGVRLSGWDGRGRRRLHYPDLTVDTATGHRVAFELELTTKEPRRRERILSAYAASPRVDAVVYLVATPAARRAIERSAARVGASDRVHVQMFAWDGGRAPGEPHRVVRRRRERRPELAR